MSQPFRAAPSPPFHAATNFRVPTLFGASFILSFYVLTKYVFPFVFDTFYRYQLFTIVYGILLLINEHFRSYSSVLCAKTKTEVRSRLLIHETLYLLNT